MSKYFRRHPVPSHPELLRMSDQSSLSYKTRQKREGFIYISSLPFLNITCEDERFLTKS